MRSHLFDRLSFLSLFFVVVLLPIFFLPFVNVSVEVSKGFLLVIGLVLSVVFWAFARFFDGKIILPKSTLLLSAGGVILAVFMSAIFSKAPGVSLFGTMFDIGSFCFIFSGFLLMFMCSIVFREPKNAKILLFGSILSSMLLLVFQTFHLFYPGFLSLGVLSGKIDNLIGTWNAFAIFSGFVALLSLLVIEFFVTTKTERLILRLLTFLSLFLIAAVNFPFVWILVGISSLIIFVYKVSLSSATDSEENHFPFFSFAVTMVALLFYVSGSFIAVYLPSKLGITNNEVSPSLVSTYMVAKQDFKKNPVLGMGPAKFQDLWAGYKSIGVNATQFWDVPFNSGSGLLPTLVSTNGFVGLIAWVLFFVLFLLNGFKFIFLGIKKDSGWEIMAFFILSLYLFLASFFYAVGSVIFLLALAFAGIFLGLSTFGHPHRELSFSFLNDHKKGFFSLFFLVVIIIISSVLSFKYLERFVSVSYFRKALVAQTLPEAESYINKSLALYVNDIYLRTYAQISLAKITSVIQKNPSSLTDEQKANLQSNLDQAIASSNAAIYYDPTNYLNFQALGSIYQAVSTFGVKDANAKAVEAYGYASALNPLNPGLQLNMAVSSLADGKIKEAKQYANNAINLKPDYVDALVVLSQIAKADGDSVGALSYANQALKLAPEDKDLPKYIDTLKSSATPTPVSVTANKPTPSKKK